LPKTLSFSENEHLFLENSFFFAAGCFRETIKGRKMGAETQKILLACRARWAGETPTLLYVKSVVKTFRLCYDFLEPNREGSVMSEYQFYEFKLWIGA
jgi:hypothetical protein